MKSASDRCRLWLALSHPYLSLLKQQKHQFYDVFSGHVNPYAKILTDLKVGKEDLKYYDLTKLEDDRYGEFFFLFTCINVQ